MADRLTLGVPGFVFADLFVPARLRDLDLIFRRELAGNPATATLAAEHEAWRAGAQLAPEAESAHLIAVGEQVAGFVARLFGVEAEREAAHARARLDELWMRWKDEFVKRRALKRTVEDAAAARAAGDALLGRLGLSESALDDEREVARVTMPLLDREAALKQRAADDATLLAVRAELATLESWLAARKGELPHWLALKQPVVTTDPLHLVHIRRRKPELPEEIDAPEGHLRRRDGFRLTDRRGSAEQIAWEVDYCLYCHDRQKDSCSRGLHDKSGAIKPNALGVPLHGCPLDERISEMHLTRRRGDSIAALALVCADNPMLPGTGHRICNDCMKACFFQKQQPVNIPQIETAVLTDVLDLPWGLEIYGLLTRWNPLNRRRPYPLPYRGEDVLVVGLGPAGYTLAHHLLNEGLGVVGIDGLKLEPLPSALVGGRPDNGAPGLPPEPVRDWAALYGELDERILDGFGGVSEYGITVRWDKNFLTLLYATLVRRERFRAYGGVRFGGTLTLDDAWAMGFSHVAIAVGAGKPTFIDIENYLIRGMRKASDFLMALQLTGAYKKSSLANLQVRLPAIVIGGGLTGIDTSTELLAYYVVQVEKTLERFERLRADVGVDKVLGHFDPEERETLDEFLEHGRAIKAERERAGKAGEAPNFVPLLESWGGVRLVYRKRMVDSPAYRLNHEEIEKFLEEGVHFVECMAPMSAVPDERGAVKAMRFVRQALDESGKWSDTQEVVELPARTVCVAAGTSPNTIYEREFPGTFQLDKRGFFSPHRVEGVGAKLQLVPDPTGFFTSYMKDGRTVSYYGDNHPRYAGSVVKAMASAKHGYQKVAALYGPDPAGEVIAPEVVAARDRAFFGRVARLDRELRATVAAVNRLTPTIVEVVVHAPLAARRFQPGQFYRLQNFERNALEIDGTRLTMEGLALTGAWTDPDKGLLSMIVLEMGHSSRLCAALRVGEEVVVMGPTGTPTEIPAGETVLLAGGGLGNAVLFSIGKALKAARSRVVYFAGYRKAEDLFRVDDIEAASDVIVWCTDTAPAIPARRPQDLSFVGNIVQGMVAYANGELGTQSVALGDVARVIAIGSDRMMRAVQQARQGVLDGRLRPDHVGIGSINSPMQCMMKEICAQCLQKHRDPVTGKETVIFSCVNQDQPLDLVDWDHLASRLRANSVQEKLANLWLGRLLDKAPRV
jgi:NADPH-dependent glutamate synthase beta subunit-like oxidoreductase/NAD(P)H-flavin reductase